MKLKSMGRAALITCASLAMALGVSSCATSTLGYLYVTTAQYGQVASLRLDLNSGAIKGVSCNTGNGSQQNCNVGSGGSNPTKLILAGGATVMYVLDAAGTGSQGGVTVFTVGNNGTIFATGLTYASSGVNPIDMYLSPGGGFLYVLDQFQPTCTSPTPTTCPGDITVFSIDGKGQLNVVLNTTNNANPNSTLTFFPVGYIPDPVAGGFGGNHMLASSSYLYVLDDGTPGVPQVDSLTIATGSQAGQLLPNPTGATPNASFREPSAIVAGQYIYVSDALTGQIWIYTPGTGGALSSPGGAGFVCPANPASTTNCDVNPIVQNPQPVLLDALQVDPTGKYLYAADYNNGTIFSLQTTTASPFLTNTSNGGATQLGTNVTCMTFSTGTEFLYVSGQGNVSGEQIDTSTGNLSTRDHTTTAATFTGAVPCIVFSPRT